MKKRVKIAVREGFGYERIPWEGHIVAGTDGTMAVTRKADHNLKPMRLWTPTHLPTGYTTQWMETKSFSRAVKNAKRLHKFLVKHKMPIKDPKMHLHFTAALRDDAQKFKPKWARVYSAKSA